MNECELFFIDENAFALDPALRAQQMETDAEPVESVEDFVTKVLGKLQSGHCDCIKQLVLIGHGSPGNINVGSGRSCDTSKKKSLNRRNYEQWANFLRRLTCRFCPEEGTFTLWSCGTGGDLEGARLLRLIRNLLQCATVRAPTGKVSPLNWLDSSIEIQEAVKGATQIPDPIPNKLPKDETGRTRSKISYVPAGRNAGDFAMIDSQAIVAARWISPFGPQKAGQPLSKQAVSRLREAWLEPAYDFAPLHLYAVEGRLQLGLQGPGGKIHWLPPGEVMGARQIYAPIAGDTCLTYLLPRRVRTEIATLEAG